MDCEGKSKMIMRRHRSVIGILLTIAAVCVLLGIVSSLAPARALPPRPPTPTPTSLSSGGSIVLELTFGDDWPDRGLNWQDLWTVVEWQDGDGDWHEVEGWQGGLNQVVVKEDVVIGQNTWWVAESDLGDGPFRWLVYQQQGGPLLATSEPFDLPDSVGGMVIVDVRLDELGP